MLRLMALKFLQTLAFGAAYAVSILLFVAILVVL